MRLLLLSVLVLASIAFAGCGDDGSGLSDEEGACLARELSQDPPEDGEGQLDNEDVPESCDDG